MSKELAVSVRLTGDASDFTKALKVVESSYDTTIGSLSNSLKKLQLFEKVQADAKQASAAWFTAKSELAMLSSAAQKAGADIPVLNAAISKAASDADRAKAAFERKKNALAQLRGELKQAGVDTRSFSDAVQQVKSKLDSLNVSPAGISDARRSLGVRSSSDIQQEISYLTKSHELLKSQITDEHELARATESLNSRLSVLWRELDGGKKPAIFVRTAADALGAEKSVDRVADAIKRVGHYGTSAFAGFAIGQKAVELVGIAEEYKRLTARVVLATKSQEEFSGAMKAIGSIAGQTGSSLSVVGSLFSKLATNMRAAGFSQGQIIALTDLVSKSLVVSGASAEEASSSMLQFAQAMGSGVLQGDEFKSLMENSPILMQALASGLGVTIGQLREMSSQGLLTSKTVADALMKAGGDIEQKFQQMPKTTSNALQSLGNEIMKWAGGADQATGSTSKLAAAIDFLAQNVDVLMPMVIAIGGAAGLGVLVTMMSPVTAVVGSLGLAIRTLVADIGVLGAAEEGAAIAGKALLTSIPVVVITASIAKIGELISKLLEWKRLRDEEKAADQKRENEDQTNIEAYQQYSNVRIKGQEEWIALSGAERESYRSNIEMAKKYWQSQQDLLLLKAKQADLDGRDVEGDAYRQQFLAISKYANQYVREIDRMNGVDNARAEASSAFSQRVIDAKNKESDLISKALDKQREKYAQLVKDEDNLAKVREERAKSRADLRETVNTPSSSSDGANLLDLSNSVARYRDAVSSMSGKTGRELQDAENQAESASKAFDNLVKSMKQADDARVANGESSKYSSSDFDTFIKQMEKIDEVRNKTEVDQNKAMQEEVKKTIETLEGQLEFLKHIDIAFDGASSLANADELLKQIQERVSKSPIHVPVVLDEAGKTVAATPTASSSTPVQKNAAGGYISGEGGPTDDKILSWLSNGEYVVKASSVSSLGRSALEYINRYGSLPKYAVGGLVRAVPSLASRIMSALPELPSTIVDGVQGGLHPINLTLPSGDSVSLSATPAQADDLKRAVKIARLRLGV